MKSSMIVMVALLAASYTNAQIKNAKTETVKVYGNCSMCETTIEKAAAKKKVSVVNWNQDTKMATITYNSKKTTLEAVLKNIALAGYDNEKFLAPDEAYNNLPGCCKYERSGKRIPVGVSPETNKSINDNIPAGEGMNTPPIQANELKPVFDAYFMLKDELVNTDATAAADKAKTLSDAIKNVGMEKLSSDVHAVWMKVFNDLKKDAELMMTTKDVEKQRSRFITLSHNMYDLIKIAGTGETIYYQFCPMANNGKGANWLSRDNNIKNPYYGSDMLTCGKTVETIKKQ